MKVAWAITVVACVAMLGCGGDDDDDAAAPATTPAADTTAEADDGGGASAGGGLTKPGTRLKLGETGDQRLRQR